MADHKDITKLPPLILGGAVLNPIYNEDPEQVPIVELLKYAFSQGYNAIDTSPYYGPSEEIYGRALHQLKTPDSKGVSFQRDDYYICTKVGRIAESEFDYSASAVRASVLRSCKRLDTDYLDLMYLHDVEFVDFEKSLEALRELRKLKDEGVILNFGISGYPLDYISFLAIECCKHDDIGPLDAVLSYCNLNIQNISLQNYYERIFSEGKIKVLCNASILSMSLLRSQGIHSFHPASDELKKTCRTAAEYCEQEGERLEDLANRYAMYKWVLRGPTVIGVSNLQELKAALADFQTVKDQGLSNRDMDLVQTIQQNILGPKHFNETWPSGIPHPELKLNK